MLVTDRVTPLVPEYLNEIAFFNSNFEPLLCVVLVSKLFNRGRCPCAFLFYFAPIAPCQKKKDLYCLQYISFFFNALLSLILAIDRHNTPLYLCSRHQYSP